jgi:hypothetical protein
MAYLRRAVGAEATLRGASKIQMPRPNSERPRMVQIPSNVRSSCTSVFRSVPHRPINRSSTPDSRVTLPRFYIAHSVFCADHFRFRAQRIREPARTPEAPIRLRRCNPTEHTPRTCRSGVPPIEMRETDLLEVQLHSGTVSGSNRT